MKLKFEIDSPSELSAGIRGFTDTISIEVESGDPGGEDGEFERFIINCLKEWYDGARVHSMQHPTREICQHCEENYPDCIGIDEPGCCEVCGAGLEANPCCDSPGKEKCDQCQDVRGIE